MAMGMYLLLTQDVVIDDVTAPVADNAISFRCDCTV